MAGKRTKPKLLDRTTWLYRVVLAVTLGGLYAVIVWAVTCGAKPELAWCFARGW